MNFFEQQDIAERNTKRLVLLLFLAVASLVAVTVLLFALFMYFSQTGQSPQGYPVARPSFWSSLGTLISWQNVGGISILVMTVVLLGGVYKYIQLSRGGRAVAEALGGRLINTDSRDADEHKILNVVEEMAIASGTPVPPVYLMEDEAINAFAAGHTPQDAVIGITRGCIRELDRDQLQGVIAHEFSHIFHGDMRLNMRLVAILNGILLLGLIGSFMVRGAAYSSLGRSRKDNSQAALLGIGIGLMVIGYAGTFFGNIIKAAVSRQREFLADASAVQFTRNPEGIAGALKKIGGYSEGSKLAAHSSAEFSHMYFSQGVSSSFNALMATHPPLAERIKRLDPNWDGEPASAQPTPNHKSEQTAPSGESSGTATRGFNALQMAAAVSHIGQPKPEHLRTARAQLNNINAALQEAARDPFSARGVVLGLLLDTEREQQRQQWQSLTSVYSIQELQHLQATVKAASHIDEHQRLALLELCLPALKELSSSQRHAFLAAMELFIQADQQVNLMEWAFKRIVTQQLVPHKQAYGQLNLRQQRSACQVLLSFLAHAGSQDSTQADAAFTSAVQQLRLSRLTLQTREQLNTEQLDSALAALQRTKPLQKPQLLKAMLTCIEQDERVTPAEAELFRAVAGSLNCPVPPLAL